MILEQSRSALQGLMNVELTFSKAILAGGRVITVGCHPVVASYALPQSLIHLSKTVQDYRVSIKHGSSRFIQSAIQAGQIDVGVVINPHPVPDLVIKKIGTDEVSVWSNGKSKSKIICNSEMFQVQTILRKWKDYPNEVIETESLELIARLADAGVGYGIIPERAVNLLKLNLHKHTELPSYRDSICIVYRPEFGKNTLEREFINSLKGTV